MAAIEERARLRARARVCARGVLVKRCARTRAQARNDDVAGYVSSGYTYSRVSCLFKVQAY